jgi:two-component system LytT family sensor kinase
MPTDHQPLIVNAVGNLAGAIAFAIFLTLALRGVTVRRLRNNWRSIGSAALALVWNVGSFLALLLPPGRVHGVVEAVRYSALSLLPAVLLDLSLAGRLRRLAEIGYVVSGAAIVMHLLELLLPGAGLHQLALLLIAGSFGALTVAAAAGILMAGGHDLRGRLSRTLAAMGLLLFVVTFAHFALGHPPQGWSKELFLHHVGIPIALLILLQDYRIVFLDAFVRFLANALLAASMAFVGIRFLPFPGAGTQANALTQMWEVVGWGSLLALFAFLRGALQQLLTRVVFRQNDVTAAAHELRAGAADFRSEQDYMRWAGQRIAAFLETGQFETAEGPYALDYPAIAAEIPWLRQEERWAWVEAAAPVRTAQASSRVLLLGRRRGGRRYLSEDLHALSQLAGAVAEEVDRFRAAEMQRLVSEAELRALQSQINPHFLFNALNTLYGIIPREADRARKTVLNLSDIFRYILRSDKALIPLAEEIKIVTAYLEIERLRLGPRLNTTIEVDENCKQTPIPILSIQPLVENAIKHGISASAGESWLKVTVKAIADEMTVTVEDSGAGPSEKPMAKGAGVGLANVTRRLQLHFGPEAGVTMRHSEAGTRVEFSAPRRATK